MIITRRDILKAIRTENLQGGSFIHGRLVEGEISKVMDSYCSVCAVGAVLRNKGLEGVEIYDTACRITSGTAIIRRDSFNELKAIKKKKWLNALSIRFEHLVDKQSSRTNGVPTKKTKENLIRFVKRHFPKQIKVVA